MTPAAPGRFSTMNCWCSRSPRCCARSRAMTSTPPPAATGTTILTGLSGYWARAGEAAAAANRAASAIFRIIQFLLLRYCPGPSSGAQAQRCRGPGRVRYAGGDRSMAEIVFGFGTSHGPLLATPPHEWDLRANVDRKNKALAFEAGTYDFPQLYELRKGQHFEMQNTLDIRKERDARCQRQLDVLGERLAEANPDALIIVGDDHHEWFQNDIQPA